jgi:hypothetical protein
LKLPMRPFAFVFLILLAAQTAFAATVESFTGDIFTGKVNIDFGGILLHPEKAPMSKVDVATLYRVQFGDSAPPEEYRAGVVLRNGVRLAAPWGPFNDPVIKFPKRNLALPAEEIAWIVYTRFPVELATNIPGGQTGVLLPKGDFFGGTIRGADATEAKILNPVFGPRTFHEREIHALILRDMHGPAAQYEVLTRDGSLFTADSLATSGTGVTIKSAFYDLALDSGEIIEIRAGANRCRPLATLGQMHAEPPEGLQILADRGFNLSPKSVASCAVPQGFTEFAAKVAAADDTPAGQRVVFSVFADGRLLVRSPALAAGDPAQNLHAALSGTHNLILRVDASANAGPDLSGHWVQAFLLRR